jgi:hypothetical protein
MGANDKSYRAACQISCRICAIIRLTRVQEESLKYILAHMPFVLVLFLVLALGATDLAAGVEVKVLIALLAPILWLGLYALGTGGR